MKITERIIDEIRSNIYAIASIREDEGAPLDKYPYLILENDSVHCVYEKPNKNTQYLIYNSDEVDDIIESLFNGFWGAGLDQSFNVWDIEILTEDFAEVLEEEIEMQKNNF